MSSVEKTISFSDKISAKAKALAKFFFVSDGTAGCLQYFGGTFLLKLLAFLIGRIGEDVLSLIYSVVFLYSFMLLIQKRSRQLGEKGTLSIVLIFAALFATEYSEEFHLEDTFLEIPCIVVIFAGVATNLRLIFMSPKKNADMRLQSPLTRFAPLTIVVYCLFIGLMSVFADYIVPNRMKKVEILDEASDILYRNVLGYSQVCRDYGYDVKVYSKRFMDDLSEEIAFLSQEGAKINYSFHDTFNQVEEHPKLKALIEDSIKKELEDLRAGLIIRFLAERQKVQPQEIEWKKEYDNLLPVGASCKYLDELAESDDFTTLEVYMRIKELAAAYKAL